MKYLLLFFSVCYSLNTLCQELSIGDATVVDKIKTNTSQIYDTKDKTYFFLTKEPLRQTQTSATNITAHTYNDSVNRVIAISITDKGQLATEWYFLNNKLIFAFESFEYFTESDEQTGYKNFKGFEAYESRYYFVNEFIKYQKHKGRKDLDGNQEALKVLKDGNTVLKYITENIKK
ncbi:hypothetical protein [Aureibaculum conchae]|uniref:hypothetical protein n=1 Tax=Aureibaculum sp. 2308TA14-22 TaxID=3108392 RepID=UPI00339AE4CD